MRSFAVSPMPLVSALLLFPAVAGAQNFYTRAYGTAAYTQLPTYETLEFGDGSAGVRGDRYAEVAFSTPSGIASGGTSASLAAATLTASTFLDIPGSGRETAVSSGAMLADRVRFERTGSDIVVPTMLAFEGTLTQGRPTISGNLWIYDAVTHAEVFSLRVDPGLGADVALSDWTIPDGFRREFDIVMLLSNDAFLDDFDGPLDVSDLKVRMRWDVPEDARFSSESGVFSPERIHPVPEPASIAALAAGVLAVRRRKPRL